MASARARSRSPLITHGEQWVTRYYCSLKHRLGVAGRRVNSRDFVRWGDRASWQEQARQRSPSSLITSLIKCVEGKCHDDLEHARSAAQPALTPAHSHLELRRCACSLEFKDAGQRNAAVDCVEKNMQRVQDSLDWCRAMLHALKEPIRGQCCITCFTGARHGSVA